MKRINGTRIFLLFSLFNNIKTWPFSEVLYRREEWSSWDIWLKVFFAFLNRFALFRLHLCLLAFFLQIPEVFLVFVESRKQLLFWIEAYVSVASSPLFRIVLSFFIEVRAYFQLLLLLLLIFYLLSIYWRRQFKYYCDLYCFILVATFHSIQLVSKC